MTKNCDSESNDRFCNAPKMTSLENINEIELHRASRPHKLKKKRILNENGPE